MSRAGIHSELDIATVISFGNLIIETALLRTYQDFQSDVAYSIIPDFPSYQEFFQSRSLGLWLQRPRTKEK